MIDRADRLEKLAAAMFAVACLIGWSIVICGVMALLLALWSASAHAQTTITVSVDIFGRCGPTEYRGAGPLRIVEADDLSMRSAGAPYDAACIDAYAWREEWTADPESGGTFVRALTAPAKGAQPISARAIASQVTVWAWWHGTCETAQLTRVRTGPLQYEVVMPPFVGRCWYRLAWSIHVDDQGNYAGPASVPRKVFFGNEL